MLRHSVTLHLICLLTYCFILVRLNKRHAQRTLCLRFPSNGGIGKFPSLQAVIRFYQINGGHQQAAEINQYLTAAQFSKDAWSFSWELLRPNRVRFYSVRGSRRVMDIGVNSRETEFTSRNPPPQS